MITLYHTEGFLKTRKRALRLVVSAGIFCIFLGGSAILPGGRSQVFAKTKDVERELETEEQWLPFVGEFRERHNFAVLLGGGRSVWNIENFGRLKGKSVQNDFVHVFLQYAFHQQIQESLGFALGSSLGLIRETKDTEEEFAVGPMIQLPGIFLALVHDVSPKMRVLLGFGAHLKRVYKVQDLSEKPEKNLEVSMRSQSHILFSLDFFWRWKVGLRLTVNYSLSKYHAPQKATGLLTGAAFRREGRWLGIGPVYSID